MKHSILIVDDEKNTREGLKWSLEDKPVEILVASDGLEALERLREREIDLLITDLQMPRMDGIELLKLARKESPETDTIILTAHATVESAVDAMKVGAVDYLLKPVNPDELSMLVDRVLGRRKLQSENEALHQELDLRYGFENIIGGSAPMEAIFDRIRHVAPSRTSVLIDGESGSGKELIASAIHFNSPRRDAPFIKLHCGALPASLLESELFGHEQGAFTHAIKQKPGAFELADGGSLFLDEISETSTEFQVKLLRVLQEQEFQRVGGTETIKIDVRIIAATNRNLEKWIEEGKFREDLYYRLNVVRISMPPLRERKDDIGRFVSFFLNEFCEENKKAVPRVSAKAMAHLQNYDWPGNVRQLRNVIEGIVVMSDRAEISLADLPPEISKSTPDRAAVSLSVGTSLVDAEQELIRATLRETEGNRAKASRLLGITRKTLYRKIEEYGL